MHYYTAYGLSIRSEIPLPELTPGGDGCNLDIRLGRLPRTAAASRHVGLEYGETLEDGGVLLSWDSVGAFLVRGGREVIVDPHPGAEQDSLDRIRMFLLGAVMGMALHQRGVPVFHASAVAIDGRAVVFLGNRGWGKSTMAAALHLRGHQLLADDVTTFSLTDARSGGTPAVYPAFPQIKLWPDAVDRLGVSPGDLPRLVAGFGKRAFAVENVAQGFSYEAMPLGGIYVLGMGASPEVGPLKPRLAMLEMVRHCYTRRFSRDLTRGQEMDEFLQCARIAGSVPAFHLSRPADLNLLSETARLVEQNTPSEAVLA